MKAVLSNSAAGSQHPSDPNLMIQHVMLVDASGNPVSVGGGTSLWHTSGVLLDGTPLVVALGGTDTSVYRAVVNPVSGDSMLVESGPSAAGPWTAWPNGVVTEPNNAIWYPSPPPATHMRITRTAGAGSTSRYYIDEISN